jgi:acetyl-CoA acetyltransferase
MREVYVLGVGAHPWGKFPEKPMLQMLLEATENALDDAGVGWQDINGITAGSSRFEGGFGWGLHGNELEQAIAEKGVPIYNVTGGCAAGGIAVSAAYLMVASGYCDVVAAVGAEKMPKGFIPRPPGAVNDVTDVDYVRWAAIGATNPAYWALECRRRMQDFGTNEMTLAKASVLMHKNAIPNPLARYRKAFTMEEVLNSPIVSSPLRLYEICATSDGAAAVILGSKKEARKRSTKLVSVAGCATATGQYGDQQMRIPNVSTSAIALAPHTSEVVGAVKRAFEIAGVGPKDVDFIELADNSSWHLLAWPELFGFFEPGQSDWMLEHGEVEIGGKLPINPSGGFLSFGEATTAMGILQVCEVVWQLRRQAGGRQVEGAKVGMTAVLGLGANGASIILKV